MIPSIRRLERLLPAALTLAGAAASAQPSVAPASSPTLETVVVTATRNAVPLRAVLADVTVISRDTLERHTTGGLADVLKTVPGLEMVRSGGPAGTTSMFVRGGETRFAAVLVDGVRVDTQTTGGATWQAIPLSQIDRIEIVRGPASAVYGSDAMAGVIQIFTRRGEPGTRFEFGLTAGSLKTLNADVSLSGVQGNFDYAVSALSQDSGGYDVTEPGGGDRDGYRSRGGSGSARVGYQFGADHRLEASVLRNRLNAQFDGFMTTVDDRALHEVETARLAWSAQWSRAWRSQFSFGQSSDHYESQPDAYVTRTRLRTATWQNDWTLGAHALNATWEYRQDALRNSGLLATPERDQKQAALALGYGWRAGGAAIQANARHDRFSEFGSVNTGSVSVGVDLSDSLRLQSSLGNAFRSPTLYQRFTEYGPTGEPLRPERSRSNFELALHHRAGALTSSVTAYRNRITDLISFTALPPAPAVPPCPGAWGCYANVGNARLQGLTLATDFAGEVWRWSASLDLLSAKNLDDGTRLARRAKQHAAVKVDRLFGATTVGVQMLASGKRFDDPANTVVLRSYSVFNLDVRHRINPEWQLFGRIDNLFDRQYQTAAKYREVPLSFYLGMRWTPKL